MKRGIKEQWGREEGQHIRPKQITNGTTCNPSMPNIEKKKRKKK